VATPPATHAARRRERLAARLRKSDTLARIGGDEFAVLLPQCPVAQARAIAEKLRATVGDYVLSWHGETFRVGASIGLVLVDGTHANGGEVLRAADAACYAAKREGRNRVTALTADV
jgi:diguanylate cyclase (GGDEF)-like protein